MSDFGETPKPQEQELKNTLSFSEVVKASSITEEAYSAAWGRGITGKRVDFPKKPEEGGTLTWGVEIKIPLGFDDVKEIYKQIVEYMEKEKNVKIGEPYKAKVLENKAGRRYYSGPSEIKLPEKIRTIRILDLSPQEALPQEQRNIPSHRTERHEKYVTKDLVRGEEDRTFIDKVVSTLFKQDLGAQTRIKALDSLFKDIFGTQSQDQINQFLSTLNQSNANEILFIHAHGRDDEVIGEETTQLTRDQGKQDPGNRIRLDEVLKKYNDPSQTAAILLVSCYIGDSDKRSVKDIPVFSIKGLGGTNRGFAGQFFPSRTSVSLD